ncbi:methylated-DNA--[protein]-cysteine S-methyltransferase [Brevundimonas balnearis]|uniref:Methylated-DNA--protein-cysteine methyltransferase n=1 Tax=Brevundimonas balnearis TaxID=1572858 RepID=A0ABV6R052_9CAUL
MPTEPLDLILSRIDSPLTPLLVVSDGEGALRALEFEDHAPRLHRLLARHYGAVRLTDGAAPWAVAEALAAYFAGASTALDGLEVRTGGTVFQRRVWAELRRIPAGTTRTYGQLAAAIGAPSAVRAVGLANGANPVGVVVPCHRVIGTGGKLTGYAGGVERKAWLLRHEGALAA